mgnify:FL=1
MTENKQPTTDDEIRANSILVLHEIREHLVVLSDFISKLDAKASSITAVAEVVDENEAEAQFDRQTRAGKEIITHFFRQSKLYVTAIIAGFYAAFFTIFSIMSAKLPNVELNLAAFLVTISLTIFIAWELLSMILVGWQAMKGSVEDYKPVSKLYRFVWMAALIGSILPAAVAMALLYRYFLINLGFI